MAEAIALIVAGTGDTTTEEIADLLNDAYPEDEYEEIGLIVPVDKDLFTSAVKDVVAWYDADKDVYPIQTKGASLGGRAASRLGQGVQEVAKFTDILSREEFPEKDWPEVHVLIAMPEDEDDPAYEFYAEVADLALKAGFKVKDLTAGLDDIVVTDPEDAEGEAPEPEPEEPPVTRRRRSRAAAKDEEPEEKEEAPKPSRRAKKAESIEEVQEAVKAPEEPAEESEAALPHGDRIFALETEVRALRDTLNGIAEVILKATQKTTALPATTEEPAEDKAEAPRRGRGRPRTDFDVRQVLDEETDEWIPRPKGRLRKGTEWRTIHAETNEVLEEGTA